MDLKITQAHKDSALDDLRKLSLTELQFFGKVYRSNQFGSQLSKEENDLYFGLGVAFQYIAELKSAKLGDCDCPKHKHSTCPECATEGGYQDGEGI